MNDHVSPPSADSQAPEQGAWHRFGSLPRWRLVLGGLLILLSILLIAVPWSTIRLLEPPAGKETRAVVGLLFELSALEYARDLAQAVAREGEREPIVATLQRTIDGLQLEMRQRALIDELLEQGELALLEAERQDLQRRIEQLERELGAKLPAQGVSTETALERLDALRETAHELGEALQKLQDLEAKLRNLLPEPQADSTLSQRNSPSEEIVLGAQDRHATPPSTRSGGLTIVPLQEDLRIELNTTAEEWSSNLKRRIAPTLPTGMGEMSPMSMRLIVRHDLRKLLISSSIFILTLLLWLLLLLSHILASRAVQGERRAVMAESVAYSQSHARQLAEAQLMVMRAQVEPHFLFNTLAHVQALQEIDPPQAATMLERLIAYLRAAMPGMREVTSTLGREIAVVRAYLELIKIRMGERLHYDIDVPAELESLPLPPTMIATLVENAIKHGLEPKKEGGSLSIQARRIDSAPERLQIVVADDGLGFGVAHTSGTGVGIANTRERLRMLYGARAELQVEPNLPSGVRAVLSVPTTVPETVADVRALSEQQEEFSPLAIQTTLLLAVIAGWFGAHRFYVGRYRTGALQALLGLLTIASDGELLFLLPLVLWVLLDLAWLWSREFLDREQRRLVCWRAGEDPGQASASKRRRQQRAPSASRYSRALTLVLAILTGLFGGHRFYLGRTGSALAMLFTLGGLGLWWLIDVLRAALGDLSDHEGRRVTEWE